MEPSDVDLVVYHHPCSDGTAAATCGNKYFKSQNKMATFMPYCYGDEYPNLEIFKDKCVLMLDVSFTLEFTQKIINIAKNFLIIDHHISAKEQLTDIDDKYKIFSMEHSGAVLAWKYFFGDEPLPITIRYIEDRDLLRNSLEYIEEFVAWFYNLPFDFDIYESNFKEKNFWKGILKKGKYFKQINDLYIIKISESANLETIVIQNQKYQVSSVNSPILKTEIGEYCLNKYPQIDFAIIYHYCDKKNKTYFSLRSKKCDVSKIAHHFKAGGHKTASSIILNDFYKKFY